MDEIDLQLREASTLAGINSRTRFDWDKGIVYDVVLLGKTSKNGFKYSDQAIDDAFKLVESAGSYIDHSNDPNDNTRKLRENFGRFSGPYKNSAGELCAKEYHFNTKHAGAEDFKWACLNIPHRIGFSIIADGRGRPLPDGMKLVEKIIKTDSFDVVDQPATTNGIWNLKESVCKERLQLPNGFDWIKNLPANTVITLPGSITVKLQEQTTMSTPATATVETPKNPHTEIDVKLREQSADNKLKYALEIASKSEFEYIRLLAKTVDDFQIREATEKKRIEHEKLLALREAKAKEVLKDDTYITPTFKNQLANAKDDAEVQALIDDRAKFALREQNAPHSAPQLNDGVGSGGVKELANKYFGS